MGNLVDRFFRSPGPLRGHVVDFLSVGWWPVFNVADPSVVGGAILLVALSMFGYDFDTVGRAEETRPTPRPSVMTDRSMPVPEGLAGMRVDAGLARLLGLSRSAAAALAEEGGVELDGVQAGKSDRLTAGLGCRCACPRRRRRWRTRPSRSRA